MLRRYETESEELTTAGCLEKIVNWASRGTLPQFHIEAQGKLAGSEYIAKMEGDALHFYRAYRKGGFLGIGGKTIEEPVMTITEGDAGAGISPEPLDSTFAEYLAGALQHH